jgi:hypothetical protein
MRIREAFPNATDEFVQVLDEVRSLGYVKALPMICVNNMKR